MRLDTSASCSACFLFFDSNEKKGVCRRIRHTSLKEVRLQANVLQRLNHGIVHAGSGELPVAQYV